MFFKYLLNRTGFISHAALLFFSIFKTGIPVIYHVLRYLVVRAAASRPGSATNPYGNKYFEFIQVLHSSVCCSEEWGLIDRFAWLQCHGDIKSLDTRRLFVYLCATFSRVQSIPSHPFLCMDNCSGESFSTLPGNIADWLFSTDPLYDASCHLRNDRLICTVGCNLKKCSIVFYFIISCFRNIFCPLFISVSWPYGWEPFYKHEIIVWCGLLKSAIFTAMEYQTSTRWRGTESASR